MISMKRQQWKARLRRALLAFREPDGKPVKFKAFDFSRARKCTVQHAYRLLEGYDSSPSKFNRIGRKPGLLDFGWVERTATTGPREYQLTDSGRRKMLKAARAEKQKGTTSPSPRPGPRRRKVPDDLGVSGPLIPEAFSDQDEDIRRRIEIARRFEFRGEHQGSLEVYQAILSGLKGPTSLVLRVWLMLRMAAIHYLDRKLDLSTELASQADNELGGGGPPWLRGRLLLAQAILLILERSVDDAMDKLQEAEALARETGDQYLLGLVLHNQGEGHLTRKKAPELAYEKFEEALELAENEGNPRGISYEKWNLGRYLIDWRSAHPKNRRQDLERARELAKEAAEIAERIKNYYYASLAFVVLGQAEEALGQIEGDYKPRGRAAVAAYKRALRLGFKLEDRRVVADSASHLARAYYRLGQGRKAEEAILRLRDISMLPTLHVTRQWWRNGEPFLRSGD